MPPSSLHIVEYLSCPGSMSLTSFTSSRLTHRREVLHPDVPAHVQVLLHRRGVGGREHEVSATFDYVPRRTEMEVIQRCSSLGHRMILSPTDSTDIVQVPTTAPACAGSSERRAASARVEIRATSVEFLRSHTSVIGPTPPGTGESASALAATPKKSRSLTKSCLPVRGSLTGFISMSMAITPSRTCSFYDAGTHVLPLLLASVPSTTSCAAAIVARSWPTRDNLSSSAPPAETLISTSVAAARTPALARAVAVTASPRRFGFPSSTSRAALPATSTPTSAMDSGTSAASDSASRIRRRRFSSSSRGVR